MWCRDITESLTSDGDRLEGMKEQEKKSFEVCGSGGVFDENESEWKWKWKWKWISHKWICAQFPFERRGNTSSTIVRHRCIPASRVDIPIIPCFRNNKNYCATLLHKEKLFLLPTKKKICSEHGDDTNDVHLRSNNLRTDKVLQFCGSYYTTWTLSFTILKTKCSFIKFLFIAY